MLRLDISSRSLWTCRETDKYLNLKNRKTYKRRLWVKYLCFILFTTLVPNISRSDKCLESYARVNFEMRVETRIGLHVKNRYYCSLWIIIGVGRQLLITLLNIKFHENPFSFYRIVLCVRTDGLIHFNMRSTRMWTRLKTDFSNCFDAHQTV
jgi:hypothetical protein